MRNVLMIIAGLGMTSCVVVSDGPSSTSSSSSFSNYSPWVEWAEAGCYWDSFYYDDIWYFEADVSDPDGPLDVVAVYADVYDVYYGTFVDSFELFPTSNPYVWQSEWLGHTTYLDCFYSGYEVDIVAYDYYDAYDVLTVWPYTY